MPRNIVIKLGSIKINMTPFGFHKYASDYLDTANKWTGETHYSPVPYFLYCRTIELGLKGYLLAKGKKLDWVKDTLGHDLMKGLKNARQNSLDDILDTTDIDEKEIEVANKYYKTKGFEYFFVSNHVTGLQGLPKLEVLKDYAAKLLKNIKPLTDNTDVE